MGFRETINKNQPAVIGIVICITVLAAFVIYRQAAGGGMKARTQAFYSIDDGASWFADDLEKVPPFTVDGKEAVLAQVYRCSDGKAFVGFLQKYTPEAKKIMEDAIAERSKTGRMWDGQKLGEMMGGPAARLLKKPGTGQWVSAMKPTGVLPVKCADGSDPEAVER